jgi:hypothetical protein
MLNELRREITAETCIHFLLRYNRSAKFREDRMAYDKRYMAQKRQRRRRKAAKAKVKLFEQGKLTHDKLPALARKFLRRKMKAAKKAE